MSELAQVLELLYGARLRFRTARGTLVHRHSRALLHEAHRRFSERSRGRSTQVAFSYSGMEEPPDLHEERLRFWWEPPGRLREEVESATRGQGRTTVHDGELWWLYTPEVGAISNADLPPEERAQHGAGGGDRFKPLLDPSGLLAVLDFTSIDASGDRIAVRARPRADLDEHFASLFHLHTIRGADGYALEIDRDTGVVHRTAAFVDGEEAAVTELTELALDEAFPDGTFVLTPPAGIELLPPEPFERVHCTLEEAAAEAPFRVFSIPELPEGNWRLDVHYHAARRRPVTPPHVALFYHRGDGRGNLIVSQRQADGRGFPWAGQGPPQLETIERDGVEYTVVHADPDLGGQNGVGFEREGTALYLQSQNFEVEALLELAASLSPVA
jgi:outer membrane lipoprotein-sorting protein